MGNTIPVIPSQNFDDDPTRGCVDSKTCKKIESSKSMTQLSSCNSKSTQKPQLLHSNTFHQQPNHSNFLFTHLFNYSGKTSKKKAESLKEPNHSTGADKSLPSEPEKFAQRELKKSHSKMRDRKVINEQQLIENIDKRGSSENTANHRKSLSCFNFNHNIPTKPVNICAPSANDYENAGNRLRQDSYTKFATSSAITIKQEERKPSHSCGDSEEDKGCDKDREKGRCKHGIKQSQSSSAISRTVTITASTSELLKSLAIYLSIKCRKLAHFHGNEVILWLRSIDRSLLVQGWQDIAFISPANVVFVYLLLRDYVTDKIRNVDELQAIVLTCLYLSYSYVGNEISYPLKPFIVESDRRVFWSRCVGIINESSAKMLLINQDPAYFTHIFTELKQYGDRSRPTEQ